MGKMIVYAAMMGVFFAGGLGVSVVLLRARLAAESTTPDGDAATPTTLAASHPDGTLGLTPGSDTPSGDEALPMSSSVLDLRAASTPGNDLPIAVRGRPMSPEEIYRFGELFKQQMAQLQQREGELKQKENRLAIMQADLENSKRELDGMRQEINDAITAGEQLLSEILQHRSVMEQQKEQQQQSEQEGADVALSPAEEAANIKRMVALFQAMPPETAGEYITELVHSGDVQTPARLLSKIEDRNAAKIIAQLENVVGLRILEEVKRQRHPEKETQTR